MSNQLRQHPLTEKVYSWALSDTGSEPEKDLYCPTRDILDARINRICRELVRSGADESSSFLLGAVLSEIGINSFDHNIGQWQDVPGVFLAWEHNEKSTITVLADRGQGIFTTLKRVIPEIASDEEALRTAFTKQISGRAPEKRGNGLKFVRGTILDDGVDLLFQSGTSQYSILGKEEKWNTSKYNVQGCLAVVSSLTQ